MVNVRDSVGAWAKRLSSEKSQAVKQTFMEEEESLSAGREGPRASANTTAALLQITNVTHLPQRIKGDGAPLSGGKF
jgi:hypothetical protein